MNTPVKKDFKSSNLTDNHSPIDPKSICVVGTGPVGLAFALRLANAGKSVTLIDSGNFSSQDQGRAFFCGTIASAAAAKDRTDRTLIKQGTLYSKRNYLLSSRYLGSGGNAFRWGIRWRPAAEARIRLVAGSLADFEARPEFDIPAWSASGADVCDRYGDALDFFGLADHSFDLAAYQDSLQPVALPDLAAKLFHFARSNAVRHDRMEEVLAHPGIDVRSDLHLVRIDTHHQTKVTGLVMASQAGTEFRAEAEHYVLALGGIENSRQLLLAKNDGALLDPHDVFGRWFCDHPHTRLGYMTSKDHGALADATAWYDFQKIQGTPVMRGHELSPTLARQLGLLRFSIDLVGRPSGDCSKTGFSMAKAWDASKQRDIGSVISALPRLATDPVRAFKLAYAALNHPVHNTANGGWSDPSARYHGLESVSVEAMFEQRPSPDNRIRLGQKTDRLGRHLPVLQWSWSAQEIDSINRSADLIADAFNKTGIGTFVTMRELGQGKIPRAGSGFHHMGGTRQSDDPASGVVNADNRVHGVENLTLIGTSIFPNTVGYANPTLTAIADALRVADRFVHPADDGYVDQTDSAAPEKMIVAEKHPINKSSSVSYIS